MCKRMVTIQQLVNSLLQFGHIVGVYSTPDIQMLSKDADEKLAEIFFNFTGGRRKSKSKSGDGFGESLIPQVIEVNTVDGELAY